LAATARRDPLTFHAFVDDLQKPWKTDLGGLLAPAQQAANKLMEELKAGREWCRWVIKGSEETTLALTQRKHSEEQRQPLSAGIRRPARAGPPAAFAAVVRTNRI
jgi:hypothetical protein